MGFKGMTKRVLRTERGEKDRNLRGGLLDLKVLFGLSHDQHFLEFHSKCND